MPCAGALAGSEAEPGATRQLPWHLSSLCIWMSTGWTLRLQVLLLGALTVRCNLKPAEASSPCCGSIPYPMYSNNLHEQPPIAENFQR